MIYRGIVIVLEERKRERERETKVPFLLILYWPFLSLSFSYRGQFSTTRKYVTRSVMSELNQK